MFFRVWVPIALAVLVGGLPLARGQDLFPPAPATPAPAPPEETLPQPTPQAPPSVAALELPDNDMFGNGAGGRGGLGFGDGFGRIDGSGILASYRIAWLNSEAITGTAERFESVREDWSIMVPIWRDGSDRLSFNVRVANTQIDTDIMVPKEGGAFPGSLWDVGFGLNYQHHFDNNWTGGLGITIGSASDQPFNGADDIRVGFNGFLHIPANEHAYWAFSLAYSPFGELAFPIPGVAYVWQPNEFFRMSIGIPFSLMWRPTPDLMLDVAYMPLTNIRARISYRLNPKMNFYGEFVQSSEGYYLSDRTDPNDRLLFRDGRLEIGTQYRFATRGMFEVFGGYVFDRSISDGSQVGGLGADAIFVNPGAVLGARLQIRW
jgi:hypothetical protein